MRLMDIALGAIRFRVLDYLVCIIFGLVGWLVGQKVQPHCRPFSWSDPHISYPHAAHPAFPTWTLAPITILPGVLYVVLEALQVYVSYKWRCALHVESDRRGRAPRSRAEKSAALTTASPVGNPGGPAITRAAACEPSKSATVAIAVDIDEPCDVPDEPLFSASEKSKHILPLYNLEEYPWRFFLLRAHYWVLAQALSVTFSMLIVDTIKVYAGRLRPDFLSRLRNDGLSPDSVLTPDAWCHQARGGRLSFPSGHSAMSFAAIIPLVLYLQNVLRCFGGAPFPRCGSSSAGVSGGGSGEGEAAALSVRAATVSAPHSPVTRRPGRPRVSSAPPAATPTPSLAEPSPTASLCNLSATPYTRFTVGLLPLILPIAVAISRTTDYRHHFDDILAGSLIGTFTALVAVLLNFHYDDVYGGLVPRRGG